MLGNSNECDEDSEESSSSPPPPYSNMSNQFMSALDDFRQKWQQELKSETTAMPPAASPVPPNLSDDESRAEELFMQGVEYEKRGKVYDALTFYRRAVQIVPDIEFRIYETAKKAQASIGAAAPLDADAARNPNENVPDNPEPDGDEDLSDVDLFVRFQTAILKSDCLIGRTNAEKGTIFTGAHISDLPMEIILYILRWVVSAHLDFRSLEQCSAVCKGLYLCARDEEIWRLACLKVWGVNTGPLENSLFANWREMFIERHRVLFNGCYISKTSYMRYGENSFQDQFYRPVQIIEYYRYIRFFPDGFVQMMTSADDPAQTVSKLRNLNNSRPEILKGNFRLHGDQIIIVLKRHQKVQNNYTSSKRRAAAAGFNESADGTQTFLIELNIMSTLKRKFSQLVWKRYTIIQEKNNNKDITTDFELTSAKYPPFWFSRVKSYHLESDGPLQ